MMSLYRNLTVLLLFLIAALLPSSHLLTHAASASPPVTRPRINYTSLDDYEDDIHEVFVKKTTAVKRGPPQLCKFDSCSENQEPCDVLEAKHGCLCPGVSRADVPPHAPRIQALLPINAGADSGKLEIKWCAPSSVVSGYKVVIEGSEGDTLEFRDAARRGVIKTVEVGTKVCVEAVNNAGSSTASDFSCMRFHHPESSDRKLLAGVIGGGVTLLLILILVAVIFWKYKTNKKAKGDSTDGLGNPTYSTEGTL
ncbi:LRRN4 C-terminal-like protein [Labrus mixtus]|uniref:LRRN4 C-terminal-like protein n=1 Tax=Labrus mixtus TaxID=508554 RepID=UPI0029C0BC6E|nr:LRRN4 C-terminal-like protein [Labrus mixtus]